MFSISSVTSGPDEANERICSPCFEEDKFVTAIELCLDCEQYLCRLCSLQHGRFKALQTHNIVKKDQMPDLSLSVFTGSEACDFECTVCSLHNKKYKAAYVYCKFCCKYLCSSCERDHNLFALTRKHVMITVEEIRREINENTGNSNRYFHSSTPVSAAKFKCNLCKRDINDVKEMRNCTSCGFQNMCAGCCEQHQGSDKDHRTIPFKEFKVIYDQYGNSVLSGKGVFIGSVCSKCALNGSVMYPSMFCFDCNMFVCQLCQKEHASHRTDEGDVFKRMHTDEIRRMKSIDHECSVCMDINVKSPASGHCSKCKSLLCNVCATLHTIYFGIGSHDTCGLKEINLRREVFFQKTLCGGIELCRNICHICNQIGVYSAAMWYCVECKKNLCIKCLDFHETTNKDHVLRILGYKDEGDEDNSYKETRLDQQPTARKIVDFYPVHSSRTVDKILHVAIDLGSSESGYTSVVFSFRSDLAEDSAKIYNIKFKRNDLDIRVCDNTKSCLLFGADEELSCCGEEAITMYEELKNNNKADSWYFFEQYDKILIDEKLTCESKIISANGNSMCVGKVFEALTMYHINTLLGIVPSEIRVEEDINLVYLVAGEVSETCHSMLRNAAVKVGICKDNVFTTSKVTCILTYLENKEELHSKLPDDFRMPGKMFLVAELGYEKVEISVRQRVFDGTCRETDSRYFGEWNFRKCVSELLEVFPQIIGHDVYTEFCNDNPVFFRDMSEQVLRTLFPDRILFSDRIQRFPDQIRIRLPVEFSSLYKKRTNNIFSEEVRKMSKRLNVKLTGSVFIIEKNNIEHVIGSCISNNISLIKTVLAKHRFSKLNTVVFFGTLLQNQDIKKAMIKNFDGAVFVSDIDDWCLTSRAAVLYGYLNTDIICPFTYGINVCSEFYNMIHTDDHRLRMASGSDICQNLYKWFFMKGEKINPGQVRYSRCKTIFPYQGNMDLYLLQSSWRTPKYADENGIEELDVISVDFGHCLMHGEVEIRMMFAKFNLLVEAFLVQKSADDENETLTKVYSKRFLAKHRY